MRSAALITIGLSVVAVTAVAATTIKGDAKRGAELYDRCQACHALAYNRTGPKHCGVVGRRAGSVADFQYSPAMKRAAITWDEKNLDRFLANPPKMVPGTAMTYAGVADARERADLIAYLREAANSPACR